MTAYFSICVPAKWVSANWAWCASFTTSKQLWFPSFARSTHYYILCQHMKICQVYIMHPPAISQKKNFPKNVMSLKAKQNKSWIQKNKVWLLNQQIWASNLFKNKDNPVIPKWQMPDLLGTDGDCWHNTWSIVMDIFFLLSCRLHHYGDIKFQTYLLSWEGLSPTVPLAN